MVKRDENQVASGKRDHRQITIGIAKKVQAAFGAKTEECGTDQKKWKLQVPQIINHYFDVHIVIETADITAPDCACDYGCDCSVEGGLEWVLVDRPISQCLHHPLYFEDDDTAKLVGMSFDDPSTDRRLTSKHCPFIPRQFGQIFDCPQQKADWDAYMQSNIICDAAQFCTAVGAVRTNKVETVWKSLLKVRTKDSNIAGDKYVCLSNIGCCLFNQPYIMQFAGSEDYCCQARFAELLGMEVPDVCRAAWDKSNKKRLKDSIRRHTKEHRVKTAKQKKLRRERKMGDARKAKVEKDSYKSGGFQFTVKSTAGSGAGGSSNGQTTRPCKNCGETAVHNLRARSCVACQQKGKPVAKAKKRKVVVVRSDSDSDKDSESGMSSEEEEYDLSSDPQLQIDIDKRLLDMRVGSRLEYMCDTNEGDSWFEGIVREVVDQKQGIVKFIEDDDGTVHEKFMLRLETWKYL